MSILVLVLLPLVAAGIAPMLGRHGRNATVLGVALPVAAALGWLLWLSPRAFQGEVLRAGWQWLPALGLNLTFRIDGLAFLFAFLILAIGLLIILYARYYLSPADNYGRFFCYLMLFMAAMIGIVLSENVLLMLVFWELTSLSSFLLIAFHHHHYESRSGAITALSVTGGGGLALLAGLLLLAQAAGSFELSDILASREAVLESPFYPLIVVLTLLGAFTKSAQFPFHFWLPHAMAAPTPVSAYLHSATMVKAGIFLMARLHPVLAGTEAWFYLVTATGLVTLVFGAYMAMFKHDLKGLLAYSTVSHLGLITLLLGLGSPLAVVAGVFHILNHATFKASLFMAAGIIDHETGTRDMRRLAGLWKDMPHTAALAMVAAAAMAGVPLLNGFLSKEMFFAEALQGRLLGWIEPLLAAAAGMFSVAYSLRFIHDVFFHGEARDLAREPHEPPRWMKVPVEILVVTCVVVGLFPAVTVGPLLHLASASVLGAPPPEYSLAIWHGFNLPLAMSLAALGGGVALYFWLQRKFRLHAHIPSRRTAKRLFDESAILVTRAAAWATARLDNGSLQRSLALLLATALIVAAAPLTESALPLVPSSTPADGVSVVVLAALLVAVAGSVIYRHDHLLSALFVGVAGLIVSLAFLRFSAPDLALTQLSVEVVSIILLLLALRRLPERSPRESSSLRRARDALLSVLAGLGVGLLAYGVMNRPLSSISPFFLEQSVPGGGGANVVNVILVDFRGFDTFGEIIVLAIAAIGVLAMAGALERGAGASSETQAQQHPSPAASSAPPPAPGSHLPPSGAGTAPPSAGALERGAGASSETQAQQHPSPTGFDAPAGDAETPVEGNRPTEGGSLILTVAARVILPLALLVAVYLFLRGHNDPGGGFIAGLVTAIALVIQYMASGLAWAQQRLKLAPRPIIGWGVLVAGAAGLGSFFLSYPFLTSTYGHLHLPVLGDLELASAVIFDLGVYLTVVGATLVYLTRLARVPPSAASRAP
ncbi:monovalent cation/H+ antiporter subunit A [Pelomicrobium sp. G1]|uniref:monovalent cation/H+ antiporter subunit A n=1 Tax=unclassified Pelomicrobium TaxID=2815318 RepID=UPI003F76CB7C